MNNVNLVGRIAKDPELRTAGRTDITTIIDLTAKFPPARNLLTNKTYLTLPTPDFNLPEAEP